MASASESPLLFEKDDAGVAWLTLNRPDVLNAANMAMRDELWNALQAVRLDPDVRVVAFKGAGDRAFSAGADISEFGTAPSYVQSRAARHDRDVWAALMSLRQPTLAAIHGYAFGAGCELALFCDFRIAAEDASFGLPEVHLGYIPSAGGTQMLPRTVHPAVARELILSGQSIDAARALRIGLVQRVVPRDRLLDEAREIAHALAALPQAALHGAKESMLRGEGLPLEDALRTEGAITRRVNGARA